MEKEEEEEEEEEEGEAQLSVSSQQAGRWGIALQSSSYNLLLTTHQFPAIPGPVGRSSSSSTTPSPG